MAAADDVMARVTLALTNGELSSAAAKNIMRWQTEPPFAAFRDRLVQDIDAGRWKVLDEAFYTVLEFGTGGRRGKMYPVGTNVLNHRTMGESARGLADYVTAKKSPDAPRSCAIARDTRATILARVRTDLCAGVGRGRLHGLSLSGLPLHPAALLRGALSELRLRYHDHRLAQRAFG